MQLRYIVKKEDENLKLKDILKKRLYISNSLLVKLKNGKCIFLNGSLTFVNKVVKYKDQIIVELNNMDKDSKDNIEGYNVKLDILYEDEYIIAINKPSNLEVHPSLNNYNKTLANMIINYYIEKGYNIDKIHIVTRLDKDTSGICLVAKHRYIQELFLRRKDDISFTKEYLTLVYGIVAKDHDIIMENMSRKKDSIIIREVNKDGDLAKTEYFVIKRNTINNYSFLKVLLHTGRTHQIRVHMAFLGHVLLR